MLDTREKELVKVSPHLGFPAAPLRLGAHRHAVAAQLPPLLQMIEEAEEAEKVRVLDKRVERISSCCESLTVMPPLRWPRRHLGCGN